MKYLLDTCVISELIARQPNEQVVRWIDSLDASSVYLSVITIGEIRKGIEKLPASQRKDALIKWLHDDLLVRFSERIVALDVEVMLEWGELTGRLEREGMKMSAVDSLIAAIVLQGDFSLVTRNEDDFQNAEIAILNPWK
jgi:tRNA(fMet)-specific endonuclease VapC